MNLMLQTKTSLHRFSPIERSWILMPRRKYGRMVHDVGSNAGKNSANRNRPPAANKP